MKILIDDNLILQSGNRAETYLEIPASQPTQAQIIDPKTLALELNLGAIKGIAGYRLIEEEIFPDKSRKISQEFVLAPDIAYSLFLSFKKEFDS